MTIQRLRRPFRILAVIAILGSLMAVTLASTSAHIFGNRGQGEVYTMTNGSGGNEILIFDRMQDGTLEPAGAVATGGAGTGSGLGSQGAIVQAGWWLLAVNAGSDDVSLFFTGFGDLRLVDVEPSGGDMPISVTIHRNLVYVLNNGGDGNISGFKLNWWGDLTPIEGSTRPLSGSAVDAAQIEFTPRGEGLVVTEKMTNNIVGYPVDNNGMAGEPLVVPSAGQTPFGFAFDKRGHLIVSEAFGGAPDASAVSSYGVNDDGMFSVISPSVGTTETAACWVVVTKNGRYAYTTNTGSGSVTGYQIHHDGSLTLLDEDGQTGLTGDGSSPIDMGQSKNGRFLYVTNTGNGTISVFQVHNDGSLSDVQVVSGLPAGITGMVAS